MGWCGVGTVIDLSEYPCEYARALPVQHFFFLWGKHTLISPPPPPPSMDQMKCVGRGG